MCCLIYKFLLILTQKMQISFLKILPENALKFVSKKMRICVKNFAQLQYGSFDVLANLYTIMDCFEINENRFNMTYHNHGEQTYSLEHFIIPDNRNTKIKWVTKSNETKEISFTGQSDRKNKLINYLIINRELNNDILIDYDVVRKIELISDYYKQDMPKHVKIIISHIEGMDVYKDLKKEKDQQDIDIVKNCYNRFLEEYFSDDNQRIVLDKLLDGLKSTFIKS